MVRGASVGRWLIAEGSESGAQAAMLRSDIARSVMQGAEAWPLRKPPKGRGGRSGGERVVNECEKRYWLLVW